MSFDPDNATVAELLSAHDRVRSEFEDAQARLTEVTERYGKAKTELVDFESKFGRVIALFKDS